MDKAMERRDLDEANRIKAQVASLDSVASEAKPAKSDGVDLFGKTWRRVVGKGNSRFKFLPDGRVEAQNSNVIKWRREGSAIILTAKDGSTNRYEPHPDGAALVFMAPSGDLGVMFPEK